MDLRMRILIVFHGPLPGGPYPVPGISLRAWSNGCGLTAHGHEVCFATRRRDLPPIPPASMPVPHPFEGRAELHEIVARTNPDLILVEGTDELAAVRDRGKPIALDLFAPRILEAQWESLDASEEALQLIDALAHADYYLATSERQRYFYLGLLPLAGVDCREDRIAVVPLSTPVVEAPREPAEIPTVVGGGVQWPWQDQRWALDEVRRFFESGHPGTLLWFGGRYPLADVHSKQQDSRDPQARDESAADPSRSGVKSTTSADAVGFRPQPLMPYPDMLDAFGRAWAFLDMTAPNTERELALSFRQLDALRCGLPLIVGEHVPIAPLIRRHRAGWVLPHGDERRFREALQAALGDRAAVEARRSRVRSLVRRRFLSEEAVKPLLKVVARYGPRERGEPFPVVAARRSREARIQEEAFAALERRVRTLREEVAKKSGEVETLAADLRRASDTIGTLSTALERALAVGESAVIQEGQLREEEARNVSALERQLASSKREIAKKDKELERALSQRDDLESANAALFEENAELRRRGDAALRDAQLLRGRIHSLEEQLAALKIEGEAIQADRDKKQAELEDTWAHRDRLLDELEAQARHIERLEQRLEAARRPLLGRLGESKDDGEEPDDRCEAHADAEEGRGGTWMARIRRFGRRARAGIGRSS